MNTVKPVRLILLALCLAACATRDPGRATGGGWVTLLDGKGWAAWNVVGDANWRMDNGAALADNGTGFLVSKQSYTDFELHAEFWVDAEANSGVFLRCGDPQAITPFKCYEVNIFDSRLDQTTGTGSVVNVAPPMARVVTSGKWNTYEIAAKGSHLVVTLNGVRTIDVEDGKFSSGSIALQRAAGAVKFRKVQIRPL